MNHQKTPQKRFLYCLKCGGQLELQKDDPFLFRCICCGHLIKIYEDTLADVYDKTTDHQTAAE